MVLALFFCGCNLFVYPGRRKNTNQSTFFVEAKLQLFIVFGKSNVVFFRIIDYNDNYFSLSLSLEKYFDEYEKKGIVCD